MLGLKHDVVIVLHIIVLVGFILGAGNTGKVEKPTGETSVNPVVPSGRIDSFVKATIKKGTTVTFYPRLNEIHEKTGRPTIIIPSGTTIYQNDKKSILDKKITVSVENIAKYKVKLDKLLCFDPRQAKTKQQGTIYTNTRDFYVNCIADEYITLSAKDGHCKFRDSTKFRTKWSSEFENLDGSEKMDITEDAWVELIDPVYTFVSPVDLETLDEELSVTFLSDEDPYVFVETLLEEKYKIEEEERKSGLLASPSHITLADGSEPELESSSKDISPVKLVVIISGAALGVLLLCGFIIVMYKKYKSGKK